MVHKSVLVDLCKVNAWNIYRDYYFQLSLPSSKMLTLCQFENELEKALMYANKVSTPNQQGRQSKWQSSNSTIAPSC